MTAGHEDHPHEGDVEEDARDRPTPNIFVVTSLIRMKAPKTAIMISAALVMTRPVVLTPSTIAPSGHRGRR